jgi:uncharacterized membrane protein
MPSPGRSRLPAAAVEAIPGAVPEENPTPARLEALSDGVFAIILTLLVLDLRVPGMDALQRTSLTEALRHQWPVYVAYVLSFLQVGVVWANHHSMFHYIRRTDHLLKVLNLLFLLWVAVLPFTTALMSAYARADEPDRRLAAQLYSGALALNGLFFNAMWRHARRAGLVDPRADPHRLHALTRHWMLIPIFYGLAFLLAYVDARVSQLMYVVLLLYFSLPGPAVLRWMTGRRAAEQAQARTPEGVPQC